MSDEFIKASIYMVRKSTALEELELEPIQDDTYGSNYRIDIRLSHISAVMEVPDGDGIPIFEYSRVNISGSEYIIKYPIKDLRERLNIN